MDKRARDLGALALALLALIWGYNWVVMKIGLEYAQPFTFSALRTFLGALSLFALLLVLRRPLRPPPLGYTIVIGLLQTTGFVGLLMWALESGGAGKTSVLTYTMPFWLLLLAWAFLGERLHGVQWLAVALALAGLVLVLEPWHLQGGFSSALAVAGGFCWAASAVVVKRLQARHEVDVLSLTTWQMLFGSLPLVLIAALTWQGGPGVDDAVHAGAALQRHPRQRAGVVPLAVRAAPPLRRRRRHRHPGDAGDRRRGGVAPARGAAVRRRGRRHGAHHRRARDRDCARRGGGTTRRAVSTG